MIKWLLVLGVIAAVYYFWIKKSTPLSSKPKKNTAKKIPDEDTMVPCEECGVFVSVEEAFIKDGKYYCSKTCMEKH